MFTQILDKMGARLKDAMSQYDVLSTTRSRQLDAQLDKIDALRTRRLESRETPEAVS